jgi:hypothetical protein
MLPKSSAIFDNQNLIAAAKMRKTCLMEKTQVFILFCYLVVFEIANKFLLLHIIIFNCNFGNTDRPQIVREVNNDPALSGLDSNDLLLLFSFILFDSCVSKFVQLPAGISREN